MGKTETEAGWGLDTLMQALVLVWFLSSVADVLQ